MPERYLVEIDFNLFVENVNKRDKETIWTVESMKCWLRKEGFTERRDGWVCDQGRLRMLAKNEILSKRRLS
jgi:hypothetical protein